MPEASHSNYEVHTGLCHLAEFIGCSVYSGIQIYGNLNIRSSFQSFTFLPLGPLLFQQCWFTYYGLHGLVLFGVPTLGNGNMRITRCPWFLHVLCRVQTGSTAHMENGIQPNVFLATGKCVSYLVAHLAKQNCITGYICMDCRVATLNNVFCFQVIHLQKGYETNLARMEMSGMKKEEIVTTSG